MRLTDEKSLLEQVTVEQFRQNLALLKAEEIEIPKKWMLELLNTIESLQLENEQLRAKLGDWKYIGLSPEEIKDMIYRFEAFLCEMTGNRMSKSNYTLDAMISAANEYQQSLCDECWYRSELAKYYE